MADNRVLDSAPPWLRRVLIFIFNHAGVLTGIALGIVSGLGLFGLGLGAIIGALVDIIAAERILLRNAGRFIETGRRRGLSSEWTAHTALVGLAGAIASEDEEGKTDPAKNGRKRLSRIGKMKSEILKKGLEINLSLGGRKAYLLNALVDRLFSEETTVDIDDLVAAFCSCQNGADEDEKYEILLQVLFDTARATARTTAGGKRGMATISQLQLIRRISTGAGISAERYNRALREAFGRDEEAYSVLGIEPQAEFSEIKRVYHKLAAQFHPDLGDGLESHQLEQSKEAFLRIREAYQRIIEERELQR